MDALGIAVSGLNAQSQRLAAIANNVANASTAGRLPTASNPSSTVYRPLNVSFTALNVNGFGTTAGATGAGVRATVTADENGYTPSYDPNSIFANADGLIAAPNVDLTTEIVGLIETKTAYKANIAVIKTQDQMLGDLLNTLA